MIILTNSFLPSMAAALKGVTLHCAWGSGDPNWDSVPVPATGGDTALFNEVGCRAVDVLSFVTPNPAGDIILQPSAGSPSGRWSISASPTRSLYVKTLFHEEDSPGEVIREAGLVMLRQISPSVPVGQGYFAPSEVVSDGLLFVNMRFSAITRTPGLATPIETVIDLAALL